MIQIRFRISFISKTNYGFIEEVSLFKQANSKGKNFIHQFYQQVQDFQFIYQRQNKKMSFSVEPIKAYLTRNTEAVTQMDPYVFLKLGQQQHKTQVIQEGGRKPQWHEKFVFKAEEDNTIKITVYDQDNVSDDIVGHASVDIDKFLNNLPFVEKYVSLKYNKKPAGKILLRVQSLQKQTMLPPQRIKTQSINRPQIVQTSYEQVYRPQTVYEEKLGSGTGISYFKNNRATTNVEGGRLMEMPVSRKVGSGMYMTQQRSERTPPKIFFSFSNAQRYGPSNIYSQRF